MTFFTVDLLVGGIIGGLVGIAVGRAGDLERAEREATRRAITQLVSVCPRCGQRLPLPDDEEGAS